MGETVATKLKNLGQVMGTSSWTQLYAVPTGKGALCSTFVADNQSATPDVISVRKRVSGASPDVKQEIVSGMPMQGSDSKDLPLFIGSEGDVIEVKSQNGTTSFTADGSETDQ